MEGSHCNTSLEIMQIMTGSFLFLFFFSSIYGYSIKQPPEDGEPATVSKRSISVFAVHHMFEV